MDIWKKYRETNIHCRCVLSSYILEENFGGWEEEKQWVKSELKNYWKKRAIRLPVKSPTSTVSSASMAETELYKYIHNVK